MVDYLMSTGSTGTMMIRDTGGDVQFWINSGNSTTFHHELPWAWNVNGTYSGWLQYNYNANAGWRMLFNGPVTVSQTVTFYLGATGTSGFGGPTTFNQFIFRGSVPSSPSQPTIGTVTDTTVGITFTDGADGGVAIDSREIGYGTNGTSPTSTMSSDGSDTVTGLTPGTLYYFWARTHNGVGYSAWSARSQATTLRVPDPPATPTLSGIGPVAVTMGWAPPYNGGSIITGYEVGYSTSNTLPPSTIDTGTSPKLITGLTPSTVYYFWVRAENAIGFSPWSTPASAETFPGARIKVDEEWVAAIPYVKYAGVWEIAVPFVKHAGVWKETI